MDVMPAGYIPNADARLICFCQYLQLSLFRPSPPTFTTPEIISMRAMPTSQFWY